MIEKMIKFYIGNLTFYAIVEKKNGCFKNSIPYIFLLCSIGLVTYFFIIQLYFLIFLFPPLVVIYVLIGRYFNAMTIKRYYPKSYISGITWSNDKIKERIFSRLKKYINDNKLEGKVDDIQLIIKEKAKNERLPFILYASIFMVLFLPLWKSYIDKLLDYYKMDIRAISSIAFLIVIIISSIAIMVPPIHTFRDNFLTRYKTLNNLSELLDEYKISKK